MGRSFYLYPNKKGIYRAEILNPQTGARVCYRTTGTKSRDDAIMLVSDWLRDGIPARKRGRVQIYKKPVIQTMEATIGLGAILKSIEGTIDLDQNGALEIVQLLKRKRLLTIGVSPFTESNQNFIKFLYDFWDKNSEHQQDRSAHGKNITLRTCRGAKNIINKHWQPYFGDKTLAEVTRQELKKFGLKLSKQLAGKTVNNILHIGTSALKWAFNEKMIPENITEGLDGFTGGGKKRDILTMQETTTLFEEKYWPDKMAYTGALVAATSGLRNGEIRAIQAADIGNKLYSVKTETGDIQEVYMLYVRHGWNYLDGLKTTKNGEEGTVHLLPEIRSLLLKLLEENPHIDIEPEKRFVFWETKKDRPCGAQKLLNGLHYAIEKAEIDLSGREIGLHSLRHENATVLLRKTGDINKVAKSLRHKNIKMTELYTDHVDEELDVAKMGAEAAQVFSNILNFSIDEKEEKMTS